MERKNSLMSSEEFIKRARKYCGRLDRLFLKSPSFFGFVALILTLIYLLLFVNILMGLISGDLEIIALFGALVGIFLAVCNFATAQLIGSFLERSTSFANFVGFDLRDKWSTNLIFFPFTLIMLISLLSFLLGIIYMKLNTESLAATMIFGLQIYVWLIYCNLRGFIRSIRSIKKYRDV